MRDEALTYATLGFKVFPLHTPDAEGNCDCRRDCGRDNGKHPRTLNGLKDATDNTEQVERWWQMWPVANIGLRTGAEGGVVVIDIDPRHGGTDTIRRLSERYGGFPEKVYVTTGGGGWHLYFRHPGFYVKSRANALGPGVDVKGEGGYVVAPPSRHASGECYDWSAAFTDIPEMPEWLKTLLLDAGVQAARVEVTEGEPIPEGGRNHTLTSFAGSMRRRGMTEEAIYAALQVENTRCQPPLSDSDIRKIAHSIARYDPSDPAYIFPEQTQMDGERPEGIYFVQEFSDAIDELYESGMKGGCSTGIPALDYHYTVKLGQWTVVTGAPSAGKSAVLDCVLHNLAMTHGWKFAVTSVENQPLQRHAAQLMSIWAGRPFGRGDVERMDRATMAAAKKWLSDHFVFILPSEGGCSVSGILDRVAWLDSNGFDSQGVVIDPWNELEHRRPAGMTETEYVSHSLTRMRHFARSRQKHLWLIAHPTKLQKDPKTGTYPVPTLYDISGSAHFRNKADMGLSVWRDMLNEQSPTEVHVQKVRFRECGRIGKAELYFDVTNGRFGDTRPTYFKEYVEEGISYE